MYQGCHILLGCNDANSISPQDVRQIANVQYHIVRILVGFCHIFEYCGADGVDLQVLLNSVCVLPPRIPVNSRRRQGSQHT